MNRLLLFLLLVTAPALAQRKQMSLADLPAAIDTNTSEWKYVYVGKVANVKADILFDRAKSWVAEAFQSAKSVIDYEDKAGGTLVAKPIIAVSIKPRGLLGVSTEPYRVALDLRVKDGRYRCEMQVLGYAFSPAERSVALNPGASELPIQVTTQQYIKQIRKKGTLQAELYNQAMSLDTQFKRLLADIDKAMSTPGKSEF